MSLLGKGGLATVVKITEQYALKILSDARAAEEEAAILGQLGSSSAWVAFHGLLGEEAALGSHLRAALLLELCDGSLSDLLSNLSGQRLRINDFSTQQYAVMMLNCVAQLHGRGIIHQDIKPSNFLFARDGSIKLCDFNLSRMPGDATRANGGTLLFFSPQKFSNADDGYAADWWALGVTLYQLLHGLQTWPFSKRSLHQISKLPAERQLLLVRKAVLKGRLRFGSLSGLPRAARTLIRGLLHPQPEQRWGLVEVLAGDYPGEQAFSAVALRFPHLAPDMERLLAVRRLCRFHWQPVALTYEEHGGADASEPRDVKTSSRANTFQSLRALSDWIMSRKRSYKCSSPMAVAAPPLPPPAEGDDLDPHDQLAGRRSTDAAPPEAEPRPPPGAAPQSLPVVPHGAASSGGNFRPASAKRPPPPLVIPAARFSSQPQLLERPAQDPEVVWTSRTRRCLPVAFSGSAKGSWRRALLLPRSDATVRAAAARVRSSSPAVSAGSAAAPSSLLTPNGRLTAPPFVPCEMRTHTLDLAAVCEALAASNAAGAGCPDSEQPRQLAATAGRGPQASETGQVQGVEVLEEMRVVLERRRLGAISGTASCGGGAATSTSVAWGPTSARQPMGYPQPAALPTSYHGPLPARSQSPTSSGEATVGEPVQAPICAAGAEAGAHAGAASGRVSPGSSGGSGGTRLRAGRSSGEAGAQAAPTTPSSGRSAIATAALGGHAASPVPSASPVATWKGGSSGRSQAHSPSCFFDIAGKSPAARAEPAPSGSALRGTQLSPPSWVASAGGDAAAGICTVPMPVAAAVVTQQLRRPCVGPHAAGPLGSPSGTAPGRPSWSEGPPACAASSISPNGKHGFGFGGGRSWRRGGAFHASGCSSASLHRDADGGGVDGGEGGGLPKWRSAGGCGKVGDRVNSSGSDRGGSGSDAAGQADGPADEAGSLFSLPLSAGQVEWSPAEVEAELTQVGAAAAVFAASSAAASTPDSLARTPQQQQHVEAVLDRMDSAARTLVAEPPSAGPPPAVSLGGPLGNPCAAVGAEVPPFGLEDERPTWGSAAAGTDGGGGGWQGLRRVRAAGAAGTCAAGDGPRYRGGNSGSPLSAASSSPAASGCSQGSPAGGACPTGWPLAGYRSGGGDCSDGGSRASPAMPGAGGGPGSKARAQRARGSRSSGLALSGGAWGPTASSGGWSLGSGALLRAIKQGGA